GLDWNDTPEAGAAWLTQHGSPFQAVGLDQTGRAVAEFGVTGAPETFVIDKKGIVRHRHVGPISLRTWTQVIRPLMQELEAEASPDDLGA
ncbi:MAG: DsbE family thiol:disulfide interchange protein, partial [Pseudomonadota bacterium]